MATAASSSRRSPHLLRLAVFALIVINVFVLLRTFWRTAPVAPAVAPPSTAEQEDTVDQDDAGAIDEWILFLPDFNGSVFWETQADVVCAANPDIRFHLVHGSDWVRMRFEALLSARGYRGQPSWTRAERDIPPWARDYFVVGRERAGGAVFLLHDPVHYSVIPRSPGLSGSDLFEEVERFAGTRARRTSVRMEGGSIVANRRHAFVNDRAVDQAVQTGGLGSRAAAHAQLEQTYGRPVVLMTELTQIHCDLYLMPAGDGRVVVGHPRRALAILEDAGPGAIEAFGQAIRDIGAQAPAGDPMRMFERFEADSFLEMNREAGRMAAFDAVVRQLHALGYSCIEVPFLSMHIPSGHTLAAFSYTNVVQDERGGVRTVYMPTYRLPALDASARHVWEGLGYQVVTIDAIGPGLSGGAIRCLSQVLRHPERRDRPERRSAKPGVGRGKNRH